MATDTRHDLAMALAMLQREEVIDFNGHLSSRLPDGRGLLINAADSVRSRIRLDDFIEIDFEGRPFSGTRTAPMKFHLHTQIYLRRPDVQAVVHAHPQIGKPQALSAQECETIGKNLSRPALLRKVWDYHVAKHFPDNKIPTEI